MLFSLLASLASLALDVDEVVSTLVVEVVELWTDVTVVVTIEGDSLVEEVVPVLLLLVVLVVELVVVGSDELTVVVEDDVLVVVFVDKELEEVVVVVVDVVEVVVDVAAAFCGFSWVFCCCSRCSLVVTPVVNISIVPMLELLLLTCN